MRPEVAFRSVDLPVPLPPSSATIQDLHLAVAADEVLDFEHPAHGVPSPLMPIA